MSKTITQNPIKQETTFSSQIMAEVQNQLAPYTTLNVPNPLEFKFEEPERYGDYAKFKEGQNTFRILSEGIFGVEYWTETFDQESGKVKNKPTRLPITEASSLDNDDWSYFYAFFVWNYTAQKIQILSTTKRGIVKGLKILVDNQRWGNITEYDICINKRQTKQDDAKSVEYTVTPEPKTDLDPEIYEKWENSKFNRNVLYMLFVGLDPFEIKRQLQEEEKNLKSKN